MISTRALHFFQTCKSKHVQDVNERGQNTIFYICYLLCQRIEQMDSMLSDSEFQRYEVEKRHYKLKKYQPKVFAKSLFKCKKMRNIA